MPRTSSTLFFALLATFASFGAIAGAQSATRANPFGPTDIQVNISGRLLMPDGKPASGGSLHAAWMDQRFQPQFRNIEVGADGRFAWQKALKQVPKHVGGMALFASASSKSGKGSLVYNLPWSKIANRALVLKMDPGGSIVGRLVGPDGKPVTGAKVIVKTLAPAGAGRFTADPEGQVLFSFMSALPDKIVRAGQAAVTDKRGRFEIAGLPRGMSAQLAPPEGLVLSSASNTPVIIARPVNQVGLLIATKPGSVLVRITDPITAKPVKGLVVNIIPSGSLQLLAAQTMSVGVNGMLPGGPGANTTNEKGEVTIGKIVPGDYVLEVSGMERPLSVRPGEQEVVAISVRSGALTGKVIGPDGKPCVNAPISMEIPAGSTASRVAQMAFAGMNSVPAGQTAGDGKFEIATFPWGAKEITLRCARGNDEAEWKGNPAAIKGDLVLQMKKAALVTVKGRLLDPQYKPIPSCGVSVIHWRDDQPRLTWLVSAQQAKVGDSGTIFIEGLRRGESFSVLSGSPFSGGGGESDKKGFESPRFEVAADAGVATQDLGDMVVHPLSGADQIVQVYGFESRDQIARLTSLMQPPPAKDVEEARKALAAYATAIDRGDLASVHRDTSRATPGWSPDAAATVRSITLRAPGQDEIAAAQPFRFIPRIMLAYVLTFGRAQGLFNLNFGASSRELEENPDWVMFVSSDGANPRSLGLMRREDGEWRVVNLGSSPFGADELIVQGLGGKAVAQADMRKAAPRLSDVDRKSIVEVGSEYLAAWQRDDTVRLQQLTSPFSSTWGKDAAEMRLALERRTDEGRCPANKTQTELAVLGDLSTWETAWLAGYAGSIHQFSGGRQATSRAPAAMQVGFPGAYATRGDIAVARYEAADGPFLMVLVRVAGDWRVLEAAIPL